MNSGGAGEEGESLGLVVTLPTPEGESGSKFWRKPELKAALEFSLGCVSGSEAEFGSEPGMESGLELGLESGAGLGAELGPELGTELEQGTGAGLVAELEPEITLGIGAQADDVSLPAPRLETPTVESEEKEQMELLSGMKSKGSREPKISNEGGVIIS